MAITFFAATSNPGDNSTLADNGNPSITPTASMLTGDLVFLLINRKNSQDIALFNTGGQTWNAGTLRQASSSSSKVFWCRFNGTWAANPAVLTDNNGDTGLAVSLFMGVWRPSVGTNTWALDSAETWNNFPAPVTPFDVTATGHTAIATNTVTIANWLGTLVQTWALQTGTWANSGNSQYRNPDPVSPGRPITVSVAYKIQTAAGATGNVVNRQLANASSGLWIVNTFKEQSAAVTVASVGDGLIHNTETGIVIAGTGFGASHTGSADIIVSPTNNIADAGAVVQTQTAWSDTSVTFTAALSTFNYFTNIYVFVKNSGGQSNANGFVIQREAWMSVSAVLKNLAGATQNNLTNVRYRVTAATINGTLIQSGTNATTDGSGNIALPTVVLTNGGTPAPGDDAWVTAAVDGVSQAVSYATCVKVTPTYS